MIGKKGGKASHKGVECWIRSTKGQGKGESLLLTDIINYKYYNMWYRVT